MRRPSVDYRQFRLSKVHAPQFAHLKLLLGWVAYFALYFLTENLIPIERCHVIHTVLDDRIPFCEAFVIPYVFWYVLVFGSLLYYLLYDVERFRQLQVFIMITQAGAMLIYILYPSYQDLRPAVMPRENILTALISLIYAFDTPTGVFPSLHVAYSLGIASVWLQDKNAAAVWKGFVVVAVAVICVSILFIKQHSAADLFAALPLALLAQWLVFGKKIYKPKRHAS